MSTLQLSAMLVDGSPSTTWYESPTTSDSVTVGALPADSNRTSTRPDMVQVLDEIIQRLAEYEPYANVIEMVREWLASLFRDREALTAPSVWLDRINESLYLRNDAVGDAMVVCNDVERLSEQSSSVTKETIAVQSWRLGLLVESLRGSIMLSMRSGEVIEHGMESSISQLVERLVIDNGALMVTKAAKQIVYSDDLDSEAIGEVIKQIGYLEDEESAGDRCHAMTLALSSPNPTIRDSAVLGLFALDSISSLPSVESAIWHEDVPEIKRDLRLLKQQLLS